MLAALAAGPFAIWAQSPSASASIPPSPEYSIRTSVRRVVVDVVVTDSQGRPATGLARQDFSIVEDGVPQQLLSFDAHDKDSWTGLLPGNVPANTFINLPREPEAGPLYVLLYDLVNTGDTRVINADTSTQIFARQQLVKFIGERPSGTRFALLANSDGLHLLQGFTADKRLLLSALDPQGKTPHMPKVFLYSGNYRPDDPWYYLALLKDIEQYVEGLPGRKNLIWASARFPFAVFGDNGPPELVGQVRKQLAHMAARQIAIYPVDAGGITPAGEKFMILNEVADQTGGRAFHGSNDMAEDLVKATEDGESYYTLSYSSTNKNYDGKLRRIDLKLARSGYRLAYRRQYYADIEAPTAQRLETAASRPAAPAGPDAPPDTLFAYMRHGMPESHDLLFSAHVQPVGAPKLATAEEMADLSEEPAYFRKRHKDRPLQPLPPVALQSYVIEFGIPSKQFRLWPATRDAQQDSVEFAVAAYNGAGYMLNGKIGNATSTTREATKYYRANQQFDVPAGAAWMCLAVRNLITGRIGNLEFALPLPPEPGSGPK